MSKRYMRSFLLVLAACCHAAAVKARALPTGPLNMAYAQGACSGEDEGQMVLEGLANGLNVIFWFSIALGMDADGNPAVLDGPVQGGPELACVAATVLKARAAGLNATHMVTVGGWGAPHSIDAFSAAQVYDSWKQWNENTVAQGGWEGFDGIDWDYEGANKVSSPINTLTVACLDMVGKFSQMAKADGYVVTLVPPESYFDATLGGFDRSLLHGYSDFHPEFQYHGLNCYAYIFSKFDTSPLSNAPTFDLVSVQLYESYSHAYQNTTVLGQSAASYLENLVGLYTGGSWIVAFSDDPTVNWPSQNVTVEASRLAIGLANAWAGGSDRAVFIMPEQLALAYQALDDKGLAPRGFVFWDLAYEGDVPKGSTDPLVLAKDINAFLHIR